MKEREIMLDNWQRIEQIIKWAGAASVSAFARNIGLNRGENLYQIKRGNNGISRDLAENITAKYPSISKAWLLTGEGDMIPSKALKEKYDIPFFKADAVELINDSKDEIDNAITTQGNWKSGLPEPAYYNSFPMLKGTDFCAFTFSDAMHPEIPRGSVLFFQRQNIDAVTPGGMYLVISKRFNGIRYLRQDPKETMFRFVPGNSESYDDILVPIEEIELLFHIKGILINK